MVVPEGERRLQLYLLLDSAGWRRPKLCGLKRLERNIDLDVAQIFNHEDGHVLYG
jgi:hypothetical protein